MIDVGRDACPSDIKNRCSTTCRLNAGKDELPFTGILESVFIYCLTIERDRLWENELFSS